MAVKTVQVTVNGQTYELTLNTRTGDYGKEITAPQKTSYNLSGHYYPITVKAVDEAGNLTVVNDKDSRLGKSLQLFVKGKAAPVIVITSPTEGQRTTNATPTITWKVTDNDSGVNPSTVSITIDSGVKITSEITKVAITGGYNCSYVIPPALKDGSHTVKVDATDFDGNNAVQRAVNFIVDTIPPELNVSSPINNLITNKSQVTVSGTTSDTTSSPCKITVRLNSKSPESVSVGSNGSFSTTVTLANGINKIIVTSTDLAGKTSTIERTVTLDTEAPVIQSVTFSKNPVVVDEVFTITAKVTDIVGETVKEPKMYRFPFKLGSKKGGIK